MHPISDFVLHGRIGQISMGMTAQQVLDRLGEPKDWLGKQTVIGETNRFYFQSDLWFYYGGSVGVRFESGIANVIIVYPENVSTHSELFAGWPKMANLKMGQWREALESNNVPFRESDARSLNYWIVAGETCVTCSFPKLEESENAGDGYNRTVDLLQKYSDVEAMKRAARYIK